MNLNYKSLVIIIFLLNIHQAFCSKSKFYSNYFGIKKDTILQIKTAIIDGEKYTVVNIIGQYYDQHKFYIKNNHGQIVFRANEENVGDFKFIDFNGDGYKDIVLDLLVADSGEQDLILYDLKSKKFVLAGDCSSAEKIRHTKYFYSYQDCCMGRDWNSYLFYISESKIIRIGHINYSDGDGISFYALNGKKATLIRKWLVRIDGDTPVTTGPHVDFDLGHYWSKHYQGYVKQ